jgi:UV DNA damage endonuclease
MYGLSMHPGQFTVLASDTPDIVERSIEEFEYHTDIIRWMGYGRKFQDFKCNVHISVVDKVQPVSKPLLPASHQKQETVLLSKTTKTNGESEHSLELADDLALVLDIHHHHWCREGEYISPTDDRFKRVIDSWRGVRPAIHYSCSREDLLSSHSSNTTTRLRGA